MNQLHTQVIESLKIFVDNMSAINLSRNPVEHGRSKHIDLRFHFLRDLVEQIKIELKFCRSED